MPSDEPGQGSGGPRRRIVKTVVLKPRDFVVDVKEIKPDPASPTGPTSTPPHGPS